MNLRNLANWDMDDGLYITELKNGSFFIHVVFHAPGATSEPELGFYRETGCLYDLEMVEVAASKAVSFLKSDGYLGAIVTLPDGKLTPDTVYKVVAVIRAGEDVEWRTVARFEYRGGVVNILEGEDGYQPLWKGGE